MAKAFSNPSLSDTRSDLSSYDSDPETHHFDFDPIFENSGCDYYAYGDDQVSFITNLFDRSARNELNCNTQGGFELGSYNCEVDLELGLGLGLGLDVGAEQTPCFEGLRVLSVDSESDCEDGGLADFDSVSDFDLSPFCWDYLGFDSWRNGGDDFGLGRPDDSIHTPDIGDDHDDHDGDAFFFGGCHDGFDDGDEEDDVFLTQIQETAEEESSLFDSYQDTPDQEVVIHSDTEDGDEFEVEDAIQDLEWEILLAVNNFNREVQDMGFNVDMYEAILGEVEDRMNDWQGSPPASLSVIQNLPTVRLSQEILKEAVCAICKDEVSGEETVTQLPCLHYYHSDCIFPWLKIRNTCPVCRHELPTDDPEYEYRKLGANGDVSLNSQLLLSHLPFNTE